MWGDPHFKGFDGSRFEYHGKPKTWYTLLKDGADLHMTTMFNKVPNTRPGTTVASQVRLVHGKDVVRVVMVRLPGNKKRLDVYIGNSAAIKVSKVTFRKEMPGGTVVKCGYHLSPPGYCKLETESVDTLVTLNSNNNRPTAGLNVIVTIKSALKGPVQGLLGRTYKPTSRSSVVGTASMKSQ